MTIAIEIYPCLFPMNNPFKEILFTLSWFLPPIRSRSHTIIHHKPQRSTPDTGRETPPAPALDQGTSTPPASKPHPPIIQHPLRSHTMHVTPSSFTNVLTSRPYLSGVLASTETRGSHLLWHRRREFSSPPMGKHRQKDDLGIHHARRKGFSLMVSGFRTERAFDAEGLRVGWRGS